MPRRLNHVGAIGLGAKSTVSAASSSKNRTTYRSPQDVQWRLILETSGRRPATPSSAVESVPNEKRISCSAGSAVGVNSAEVAGPPSPVGDSAGGRPANAWNHRPAVMARSRKTLQRRYYSLTANASCFDTSRSDVPSRARCGLAAILGTRAQWRLCRPVGR